MKTALAPQGFKYLWLLFCFGCISIVKPAKIKVLTPSAGEWEKGRAVTVLIDENYPVYQRIIMGIHVASQGNYSVIRVDEHGIRRAALFDRLVDVSPKGVIAIGPRSAISLLESQILLPSVISMAPWFYEQSFELNWQKLVKMTARLEDRALLIKSIFPLIKNLGFIHSKQYPYQNILEIKNLFDKQQINLKEMEAQNHKEVINILSKQKDNFDALFMEYDQILLDSETLKASIDFLNREKKPFIALDCSMVASGALLAFENNYLYLGKQLYEIIQNDSAENVYQENQVIEPEYLSICVNFKTAKTLGLEDSFYKNLVQFASMRNFPIIAYDKDESINDRPLSN